MVTPDPDAASQVEAITQALWAQHQAQFIAKAEHLDDAVLALVEGTLDEATRAAAEHEAHQLSGTVGMFGLDRASEAARELELIFSQAPGGTSGGGPMTTRAAELVDVLVADVEAAASPGAARTEPAETAAHTAGTASGGQLPTEAAFDVDDLGRASVDVTVVEDDEILAGLIHQSLEAAGMRCAVIHDGLEAQRRLAGSGPTLSTRVVLLDLNLPSRGGIEVLRGLRVSGILGRTSVIVLTARATEADTQLALSEGAIDHIAKPFSIPMLVAKLQEILRN